MTLRYDVKKENAKEIVVVARIENLLQSENILGSDFHISYFVTLL